MTPEEKLHLTFDGGDDNLYCLPCAEEIDAGFFAWCDGEAAAEAEDPCDEDFMKKISD